MLMGRAWESEFNTEEGDSQVQEPLVCFTLVQQTHELGNGVEVIHQITLV